MDDDIDLSIVDQVFGARADLYRDVLGVSSTTTRDALQRAYLEQREALVRVLAEPGGEEQRRLTERKLDAVVLAGRVLTDPELRLQYDEIRPRRIADTAPRQKPQARTTPVPSSKRRSSSAGKSPTSTLDTTWDSTVAGESDEDDEGTVQTVDTMVTFRNDPIGYIQQEVVGIVDDTSRSFDQVCSVFTLRPSDIDAVTHKIHKAKHQIASSLRHQR